MARARNIKPNFFTNDVLADNDPLGRLLFIGLWTLADFKGELEWRAKRVKAQVLPYDECDIVKLAINLDKSGFIRFYSDGEKIYVKVLNFEVHQNPHKNERSKGSTIPGYSESMRQRIDLKGLTINRDKSGLEPESSQSDPADSLKLIPDSLNPIKDSSNSSDVREVFEHWQTRMNHPKAKLDNSRRGKIKAALKTYPKDDLIQAIDGCAKSTFHMGQNDKGTVYDGLDLILRNADHIEKFIRMNTTQPVPVRTEKDAVRDSLRNIHNTDWAVTPNDGQPLEPARRAQSGKT